MKNKRVKAAIAAALLVGSVNPAHARARSDAPVFSVLRRVKVEDLGRPRFRHRNPVVVGQLYVFRQPLFDTYMVAPNTATAKQTLFTVAQGQNTTFPGVTAYAKQDWDTNMLQNAQLPQPQKFYCRAIMFWLDPQTIFPDSVRTMRDTYVQFLISTRAFFQGHLNLIPGGASLYGGSSGIVSNGMPLIAPLFETYGDNGETIEQGQSPRVILDPTLAHDAAGDSQPYTTATTANGGVGVNGKVYLDGLLFRELM